MLRDELVLVHGTEDVAAGDGLMPLFCDSFLGPVVMIYGLTDHPGKVDIGWESENCTKQGEQGAKGEARSFRGTREEPGV